MDGHLIVFLSFVAVFLVTGVSAIGHVHRGDADFRRDYRVLRSMSLAAQLRADVLKRSEEQEQLENTLNNAKHQLGKVREQLAEMTSKHSAQGRGLKKVKTREKTVTVEKEPSKLISQLEKAKDSLLQKPDGLIKSCVPLLVQQKVDESAFFNKSWKQFKVGFNSSNGNYWLGNELLHQLTKDGRYKLRFELQSKANGRWYWAGYNTFIVFSEATQYELHVDNYNGNAGYDALDYHDRMAFTTYDRDNDLGSSNCASVYGSGFWYGGCYYCSVNGAGVHFYWHNLPGGHALRTSRMWLVCR